ncbi:MAG: MerR family transcriptional regulator [Bacteroidota bacterium]
MEENQPDLIMDKTDNVARIYYTIGEVAAMFNVNTSLIRFWEKEFDIIQPKKNKKGNRLFTQKDVDNFHLIFNLVKERGYTLKGAREKLRKNPEDTLREYEIIKSLNKIEEFLRGVKRHLDPQL